ncbi:MAG TPA: hypothetical protein DEB24_04055 [Coriobacteriia bacterium]|nr:hypothetical protein [Coriobacteriia bacterium]
MHLTIMAHEEALVASLTLDLLGESERVGECVGAALEELVADLEASGAMIGHVKAALSRVTPIMLFNSVGGGVTGKTCRGDAYRLELAAIVFFVDQEKLLSTVQDVVKQLT